VEEKVIEENLTGENE